MMRRVLWLVVLVGMGILNPASITATMEDCTEFVADVTLQDDEVVLPGTCPTKTWRIKNCGSETWTNRYVTRQEAHNDPKGIQSEKTMVIPAAKPGETIDISVQITMPMENGTVRANWKMTTKDGKPFFPENGPLYVRVRVQGE